MENKKLYTAVTTTKPQLYKNFFRVYYNENWRAARIICTALSVPCALEAIWFYQSGLGIMWSVILLWAAAVLNVYPRQAYRRQYRTMKDMSVTTKFDFYEDFVMEKSAGASEKHMYADMHKIIETGQYFYLFHSKQNVSVVEKSGISDSDITGLRSLFKSKTDYKLKK